MWRNYKSEDGSIVWERLYLDNRHSRLRLQFFRPAAEMPSFSVYTSKEKKQLILFIVYSSKTGLTQSPHSQLDPMSTSWLL